MSNLIPYTLYPNKMTFGFVLGFLSRLIHYVILLTKKCMQEQIFILV